MSAFAPWAEPGLAPLLSIEGVSKRFGTESAVADLSLGVYEREFFALLGPSGCGKSTLLRLIAGFEKPDAGRLMLAGKDLAGVPPHRRPVNMMFQSYALFPHMDVAANVGFGLRQEGLPRAEIAARVDAMLRLVRMERFGHRRPDQLSGGQRQRVALARALVKRPKLLLLDEPLAALDRKLREETRFELVELQQRLGLTFIIVTHDQEEAMTMATRIAVMDHGRIAQVGTPAEIYEAPTSRAVAEFVGDVTLLPGRVAAVLGETLLFEAEALGLFTLTAASGFAEGGAATLALRPEKLVLSSGDHHAGENRLAGTIADIAYLGDMSLFRVRLSDGRVVKVSRPNATRTVARPLSHGDAVTLSFAPDSGVLLAS